MSRPLFPLRELLRRGVRREWIRNKWLTLGDGTRHYVHENHVQWLRIYLNTIDRHVPPNAQGSVLMEDENLQKSMLVDIMTAYETRRRGAASSSLSSSLSPPPRRGTKRKRRFDALDKSQPPPVRKRRHVTFPSPSSHASSPSFPAPPSPQPSTSSPSTSTTSTTTSSTSSIDIAKNLLRLYLGVQGHSRSSMLTFPIEARRQCLL